MNKIEHTPKLTVSKRDPNSVLCDGTHVCQVQWACTENQNSELNAHWAKTIVSACNEHAALVAVAEAARALLDASLLADKQWVGLNMLRPGQKRAYEIMRDGKIQMERSIAALAQIRGGAQ